MSSTYKRVVATLNNGKSIYVYNMDMNAALSSPVVLNGLDVISTSNNGVEVVKVSDPESGWFTSIPVADTERFVVGSTVARLDGHILARINPLKSFSVKDFDKAIGGAK